MIRDFSEAKKEELCRVLDMIDNQNGEPFEVWFRRRAADFGQWPDRLGIYDYIMRSERFKYKILHINNRTRKQIEANFEGVKNADAKCAGTFRGYAEAVKEQIEAVRIMMQFMQSAGKTGLDIDVLLHGLTLQSKRSYTEQLEEGQKVLLSYLSMRGITDPAEQQEIRDLIMEKQPYLLKGLYIADYYSSENAIVIYNSIMEYYHKYKKKITLMGYLEESGIIDSVEQQKIYDQILDKQPDMLDSLYTVVYRGNGDASAIYDSIMDYYNKHKMDITIQDVEGLDMGERMDQTQRETFVACWNRLGQMELSKEQIIAVMANIYAESRCSATNAQESYGYIGLYDDKYTFLPNDNVGYGICQWTIESRKTALQEYANSTNGSVYELETQLNYFQYEMEQGICKGKWEDFLAINDRDEAVVYFWRRIEISGASIKGPGDPDYESALADHISFADSIENWYETTFQQEAGE